MLGFIPPTFQWRGIPDICSAEGVGHRRRGLLPVLFLRPSVAVCEKCVDGNRGADSAEVDGKEVVEENQITPPSKSSLCSGGTVFSRKRGLENLLFCVRCDDDRYCSSYKLDVRAPPVVAVAECTSIHGCKPAKVVTSELPLGLGLGSSTAFCLALSAELLTLSDSVKFDFSHQGWQMFGENELELVNKWSFEGEKIIHGRASHLG